MNDKATLMMCAIGAIVLNTAAAICLIISLYKRSSMQRWFLPLTIMNSFLNIFVVLSFTLLLPH